MLESIAIALGSILLVLGIIGLMTITIGTIVLIHLWRRNRISEKIRGTYAKLKWYISGRGFGSR